MVYKMKREEIYNSLLMFWTEIKADDEIDRSIGYWLVAIQDTYIRAVNQYPCKGILIGCLLETLRYSVQCIMQHGGVRHGFAPAVERLVGTKYTTPTAVFPLIDNERAYQDDLDSNRINNSQYDTYDYFGMLGVYIRRAQNARIEESGLWPCLDNMRKIATTVVHCLEDLDI